MSSRPKAIGYIRRERSGIRQLWHEEQIRSLAKRYGYDLSKTVVFSDRTDDHTARLCAIASNLGVEAVFTPGDDHFDGRVPAALVAVADVITVNPEETFARRAGLN